MNKPAHPATRRRREILLDTRARGAYNAHSHPSKGAPLIPSPRNTGDSRILFSSFDRFNTFYLSTSSPHFGREAAT